MRSSGIVSPVEKTKFRRTKSLPAGACALADAVRRRNRAGRRRRMGDTTVGWPNSRNGWDGPGNSTGRRPPSAIHEVQEDRHFGGRHDEAKGHGDTKVLLRSFRVLWRAFGPRLFFH